MSLRITIYTMYKEIMWMFKITVKKLPRFIMKMLLMGEDIFHSLKNEINKCFAFSINLFFTLENIYVEKRIYIYESFAFNMFVKCLHRCMYLGSHTTYEILFLRSGNWFIVGCFKKKIHLKTINHMTSLTDAQVTVDNRK